MTAPWSLKHKWWKKCLIWWLWQKPLLKRAALIHSTVEQEREWNHELGLIRSVIAPLGTHLPKEESESSAVHLHLESTPKTLLFVGRVYPVKALDRLIEAFSRIIHLGLTSLDNSDNSWCLRIVGPDQAGHMSELMQLCEKLGLSYSDQEGNIHSPTPTSNSNLQPQVAFAGPKFGADLDAEYANCDCLALVSHTENFGATVVDAMAHGKPVITSTNTPWKEVEGGPSSPEGYAVASGKAGWWVDNDVETLASTLRSIFNTPTSTLEAMGARGRKMVEEKYTWQAVAKTLERAYLDITL